MPSVPEQNLPENAAEHGMPICKLQRNSMEPQMMLLMPEIPLMEVEKM